jgi:hypothetical protein
MTASSKSVFHTQTVVTARNPSSSRRRQMEQPHWFIRMDENWMWRWFIADANGQPLAVSRAEFFNREDAVRNLEVARLALNGF